MRAPLLAGLILTAWALWPWSGQARASSAAEAFDLAGLVAAAELISEVQVMEEQAALLPDGRIETRYTLSTLTPLKGAQASIQEVRMPGGEVAGRGLVLPGLPRLRTGQRLVLFLTATSAAHSWRLPVGLGAGAFEVHTDPVSGAVHARSLDPHAELAPRNHDEFLADILAEVQRQG
jgi:hypothetical protein